MGWRLHLNTDDNDLEKNEEEEKESRKEEYLITKVLHVFNYGKIWTLGPREQCRTAKIK